MPKVSKFSKDQSDVSQFQNGIHELLELPNLPAELKEKAKVLLAEAKAFDLTKLKVKPNLLLGHISTQEELLALIKESSGFTKWTLEEIEEDELSELPEDLLNIKETYAVDFDETKIQKYRFYRKINNRSAIYMVDVIALPGFVKATINTDRVCMDIGEGLITLKQLKEGLDGEFEAE